jgi:tetratricopeptide (TPR) repeat protein
MKRFFILLILFSSCSITAPLKKGRLISLNHLIEIGKYEDAKVVADELVSGEDSLRWANAWYARGYLCQTAYREGIKKNDAKLYQLYPDQLYVAWDSYEQARTLDKGQRMEGQLARKYVPLANDFQNLGVNKFAKENYEEALLAFEHALKIKQLPFLSLQRDTLLVYNTALAAYENKDWAKAIKYLKRLHDYHFSENATHLLYHAYLMAGDSVAAEKALFDGLVFYQDHEDLVFLLVGFLVQDSRSNEALEVINMAIAGNPENARYYYNKGLILQKNGNYQGAIDAYRQAQALDEGNLMVLVNLATCYYNIGVAYEENTLKLSRNQDVKKERVRSKKAFDLAMHWLDSAMAWQPNDLEVISRLSDLYIAMGKTDKTKMLLKDNE